MTKMPILLVFSFILISPVTGCDALQAIVPLPQATIEPTATVVISTPTALPTLGNLEYLDATYCLIPETSNLDAEYNLLRFFSNGVVLEMTVQGYSNCQEAWQKTAPYISATATDTFSHGEYQFSGSLIQFWLGPAGSNQAAGTVTGKYAGDTLILQRQGAEMIYTLVYGGKQP
jgi:hypothetical protein